MLFLWPTAGKGHELTITNSKANAQLRNIDQRRTYRRSVWDCGLLAPSTLSIIRLRRRCHTRNIWKETGYKYQDSRLPLGVCFSLHHTQQPQNTLALSHSITTFQLLSSKSNRTTTDRNSPKTCRNSNPNSRQI